jgi:exopolysaccharide biosynthesis WecB/TagA/CpsF family protein
MDGEVFSLFDIPIQRLGFAQSLNAVAKASQNTPVRVFFVNAYSLVLSQGNRRFKRCLQLAEFCLSEGNAISIACRFLGEPSLPSHIKSTDWVPAFFDLIENDPTQKKMSIFCLGGRQKSADTLSTEMMIRWPKIQLVRHIHKDFVPEEEEAIVNLIEEEQPEMVLLGLETVREEQFICRHWHRLKKSGVKIAIAGGQAIDSIAKTIPMTPRLARAIHLEWLFQMILEPRKFYAQYLKGGPVFMWYLMKQKGMKERK